LELSRSVGRKSYKLEERMIRTALSLLVLTSLALAADAPPAFDVASIRPSEGGRETVDVLPGTVTMRNMRVAGAIRWAYNILDAQVSGPDWLNSTRFDIIAKASTPAREAEMRTMMQKLLADRFKLEFHRQIKDVSALVLTVGKNGHKLKEVEQEGSPSFQTGRLNLTGKGATVAQLIVFLSRELRQPIVDQTGLVGRYDYFLDINAYVTEEMRNQPGPPAEAPSIIAQALQAQLGLRVDPKKVPLEVLIIDKMEKTPTDN
jgi:uncharacterized protein (TIGR03435 family)